MGDRANICIHDEGAIYLYTHWRGRELPTVLQAALRRGRERWDDGSYLARIIFCEMIQDDVMDTTGYGLSTYCCDGHDRIAHINCAAGTVRIDDQTWSFAAYIALPQVGW